MGSEPAAASGGNRQAERRESQGVARGRDCASSPAEERAMGNARERAAPEPSAGECDIVLG